MQKILIVDDDKGWVAMLQWHLLRNGYEVLSASGGDEALEILKRHTVDLVLTDILMPGRDGLETIQEIHKRQPGLKVMAMSGGGMCGSGLYMGLSLRFGAVQVLEKPFTSEQLLAAVTGQLRGAEREVPVAG